MKARETFWPCAPDGFIPNSIVRENYIIKNTIIVQEEHWKPPEWREEWGAFPRGSTEEDEGVKTWLSDDDDKTDISSNDSIDNHRSSISSKLLKQNEVEARYFNTDINLPDIMPGVSHGIISSNEKKTLSWANGNENDGLDFKKVETLEEVQVQNIQKKIKLYLPPINDEQEIDGNQLIPFPFLQYYQEEWFPKEIGYEVSTVCEALINGLKVTATDDLKDALQCLIKAHRFSPLISKNLKELISILLELLENEDPIVRIYAAQALRGLQNNQENVVVKLIQKLDDPSFDVREEVKVTLKEIAGIVDASTLKAILQSFGKYKEMDIPNDASVIRSLQDHLLAKRESFKNKIHQLYRNYGENDKKMLGIFDTPRRPRRLKLPKIRKGNLRQVIEEENEIANDCISVNVTVSEKPLSSAQERDRDLPTIQRLVPSAILQNMDTNVIGERILVGFHVLPKIHQSPDETIRTRIIRPIPERNGCETADRYGSTSYGMMDYKWTTFTSYYDRGVNVFNELKKQDVCTNNDEHITYRNDRFGNSGMRKPTRLKRQSDKTSDTEKSKSPIKYNTILPKIKRELKRYNDREIPMRPSIAAGAVI